VLHLDSEPGAGTTARAWLPVAEENAARPPQLHLALQVSLAAAILLVEDDPLIAGSTPPQSLRQRSNGGHRRTRNPNLWRRRACEILPRFHITRER
jgi:hypothetical protein